MHAYALSCYGISRRLSVNSNACFVTKRNRPNQCVRGSVALRSPDDDAIHRHSVNDCSEVVSALCLDSRSFQSVNEAKLWRRCPSADGQHGIINWVQIRAVWWPYYVWLDELQYCTRSHASSTQRVSGRVGRRPVLLQRDRRPLVCRPHLARKSGSKPWRRSLAQ